MFQPGKKTSTKRTKKKDDRTTAVTEDITQTQKQKPRVVAPEGKEDTTQNEKKKKAPSKATSLGKGSRANVISPEVEKVVEKFVKHATESGIEALRGESRDVLEFKPNPGTYEKFASMPDRNRFPEIQCLDETRVVLEQSEPNMNTYIHASRVKMDKETCAGIVMLCNYYEDGMQKCDEYFPTESGAYKYYGKMFVNNKKVDHMDQHDIYTLEILPDGCSNSILTRLAHCTTWPDKAVPSSGRMVLRLLKWMQSLEAESSEQIEGTQKTGNNYYLDLEVI
ncbi:unnamed protein product [Heligmosomoides polygyrus]|uniref:Tyrosine-protein phosphatase domain-containing protein n=1 Tax=Heligmosomoides polygyrus TaxID=6339 RepID=A0A3P7XW19_HELPZ|nr:unnamed protein product [Heligmosomoides polygyrus]